MNVRPLHDRIVVQRLEESVQQSGAIVIPDSAKEKPQRGKVLAAGLGKSGENGRRLPLDVKAGTPSCSASTPVRRSSSMAWSI
jgi:chaperonin GroES